MKPHAVATHATDVPDTGHEPLDSDLHGRLDSSHPRWRAMADRSREAVQQLGQHYSQAQRQTQERVRQHPLQSVAVAVGLGVLLGAVITRLSSTRTSPRSN